MLFRANSKENLGFCVIRYFLLFRYFELFQAISLNFEKQFQEMMNKFKIKPIRVNYTLSCSALTHAGRMSPNSQILGHRLLHYLSSISGSVSVTDKLINHNHI